jgi:hypothetical protein
VGIDYHKMTGRTILCIDGALSGGIKI